MTTFNLINQNHLLISSLQTNDLPHIIIVTPSEMLICSKSYPKFQNEKFFSYVMSVATKYKPLGRFLLALSKINDITMTKVVSQNISQSASAGRKKQNSYKMKQIRSPENHRKVICMSPIHMPDE